MAKFRYAHPLAAFGRFLLLLRAIVVRPERGPVLWQRTLEEAVSIGVGSVVVGLVAVFIGAVTCVQIAYNMVNLFVPIRMVGYMVREMAIPEMAPTITSIVLAGKVGSAIAGGLGTMRLTEQISALDVMRINSASYLILPRLLVALLVFPLLVTLAMSLGILGGYLAGQALGLMTSTDYVAGLRYAFVPYTVGFALIKAVIFAFLITSISAYKGYTMRGGARRSPGSRAGQHGRRHQLHRRRATGRLRAGQSVAVSVKVLPRLITVAGG